MAISNIYRIYNLDKEAFIEDTLPLLAYNWHMSFQVAYPVSILRRTKCCSGNLVIVSDHHLMIYFIIYKYIKNISNIKVYPVLVLINSF